jgi:hypothetical protein
MTEHYGKYVPKKLWFSFLPTSKREPRNDHARSLIHKGLDECLCQEDDKRVDDTTTRKTDSDPFWIMSEFDTYLFSKFSVFEVFLLSAIEPYTNGVWTWAENCQAKTSSSFSARYGKTPHPQNTKTQTRGHLSSIYLTMVTHCFVNALTDRRVAVTVELSAEKPSTNMFFRLRRARVVLTLKSLSRG